MKTLLGLVTLAVALTNVHTHHVDHAPAPESTQNQDSSNNIIFNGYVAPKGQVPYIVFLLVSNGTNFGQCGGSIIANTWILTAAHCLENRTFVVIFYGATTALKSETKFRVEKENFIIHELYSNNTKSYDIALIRTPHVEFTNEIKKVDLPPSFLKEKYLLNVETKACGWGNISSTESTDILRCVYLRVIKNKVCREEYMLFKGTIDENMLCTDVSHGKAICAGDSGGPLVIPSNPPILIGVVYGSAYVCNWKPSLFTRVTSYLNWIRQKMDIL